MARDGVYMVVGTDEQTLPVEAEDLPAACAFAESRGVDIAEIKAPSGRRFRPNGEGGFVDSGTGTVRANPDAPLMFFSLFIPIVGVLAGSIRLATGKGDGVLPIVLGITGAVLWTGLFALASM